MSAPQPKSLKHRTVELLLDSALQVIVRTIDTVKFVRKMKRRYQARHVKLRHAASPKR
ncbi:MAG: hypothetical protein AAB554_05460 [Patescibacteria group bacterium]